jgi:hypothetical protein
MRIMCSHSFLTIRSRSRGLKFNDWNFTFYKIKKYFYRRLSDQNRIVIQSRLHVVSNCILSKSVLMRRRVEEHEWWEKSRKKRVINWWWVGVYSVDFSICGEDSRYVSMVGKEHLVLRARFALCMCSLLTLWWGGWELVACVHLSNVLNGKDIAGPIH